MARRKKGGNKKPSDMSSKSEATLKQLQTQLTDPRLLQFVWSGAQGVRERIMTLNFGTLRNVVDKLPLVNGIINARIDQVMPYCKYTEEENERGYQFVLNDRRMKESEFNETEVDLLVDFVSRTGYEYDPMREDDFMDFVQMVIRETLVVDQIATEIQWNRVGEARAFWLLDGATIKRVTDESQFNRNVRFVQQIDEQIYNEFRGKDIVFDYKYKRADIRFRGYGYSPVEQCVDIITTLLFGYNYIRDQLMRDRVPRGFISVMGDVGKTEMDSIRNYWYSAMTGAGAQFNIPILPSGKDGVGVDFKTIGSNNKDMEFHKTLQFVSSLVSAVYSMDLLELGIKTDDTSSVIGENPEPRIASSKDRGLHSLLMYIQQYMNKIIRRVGDKYKFEFVGLIQDDEDKKAGTRTKEIGAYKTIDEIREEDGESPFKEDWSTMPLHPQAVQIFLAGKQAEAQSEMSDQYGAPSGFGGYDADGNPTTGNQAEEAQRKAEEEADTDQEKESVEKSFRALEDFRKATRKSERVVRHIIG